MARVTMCSGVSASHAARPSTFSCRRTASVAGAVRFRAPSVRGAGCHHKARGSSAVRAELPSLVPEDSADALGRFRKVMTVLYAAGGALHFPDLLGQGPISSACGTSSFSELSPLLQTVTAGWAFLGPVASFGLATSKSWGDAIVVAVASCEVVLGSISPTRWRRRRFPRPWSRRKFCRSPAFSPSTSGNCLRRARRSRNGRRAREVPRIMRGFAAMHPRVHRVHRREG